MQQRDELPKPRLAKKVDHTVSDKGAPNKALQKYEPSEHKEIGNRALAKLLEKDQSLKHFLDGYIDDIGDRGVMIKQENILMTAGDWVALAGDFYGRPSHPISGLPKEKIDFEESKKRFEAAYLTLAGVQGKEKDELNKLLNLIAEQEKVVAIAKEKGESASIALHKHSAESNSKCAQITAKNKVSKFLVSQLPLAITGLTIDTRYLKLSERNFDHFGEDAKIAYRAGHEVALKTAAEAKKCYDSQNWSEWKRLFTKAITQELFACHFLTDLFAAGHMRVPRKEMVRAVGNYKIAGLMCLMMHNEDGDNGLWVTSGKHKEPWFAKGDACSHDKEAKENKERAIEAVFEALNSIYEASKLEADKRTTFNFEEYIPVPLPAKPEKTPTPEKPESNTSPLYISADSTVSCRKDLYSPKCYEHSPNWHSILTLTRLWMFKDSTSNPPKENTEAEIKSELEKVMQLEKTEETDTLETENHCLVM